MSFQRLRTGYTLVEIVFTIMILGIIGSIGSEIIVQVYSAYLQQRTVHNASIKTELAINQIANRLVYRIDRSVVARKLGQTGNTPGIDIFPLREVPDAERNNYTVLEWIGYDNDTFSNDNTPSWSGYCNVNTSTFAHLDTPGSSGGTDLDTIRGHYNAANAAIVFAGYEDYRTTAGGSYTVACMYAAANGCIFPINTNTWNFTGGGDRVAGKMIYTEFYRLAVSAFSITQENPHTIGGVDTWDLHLRYGYQPWDGDDYTTEVNNNALLLRNVSVFRFIKETNNIRIKLCVVEQVGNGANDHYSVCKEKAVIR